MPTVLCHLELGSGKLMTLRCLINTGSPFSIVSAPLVQKTGLPQHTVDEVVLCRLILESLHDEKVKLDHLFRLEEFETITPTFSLPSDCAGLYRNITLGDPDFFKSDDVDVIIGMDLYNKVVIPGRILKPGQPDAINTIFGYAVTGAYLA